MLTHIVIWKYRAEVEEELRAEHVERLRRLASLVDGLISLHVGFDVLGLPRSYDTGLVAVFRDRAALEAYTVHPDHVVVADFGRALSAHVASVDFEENGS
ncbi:MAG: Dabb family protein [Acidobacteria bacterium]|nr:Dabb family protein [Acidobacteriota bacterium]